MKKETRCAIPVLAFMILFVVIYCLQARANGDESDAIIRNDFGSFKLRPQNSYCDANRPHLDYDVINSCYVNYDNREPKPGSNGPDVVGINIFIYQSNKFPATDLLNQLLEKKLLGGSLQTISYHANSIMKERDYYKWVSGNYLIWMHRNISEPVPDDIIMAYLIKFPPDPEIKIEDIQTTPIVKRNIIKYFAIINEDEEIREKNEGKKDKTQLFISTHEQCINEGQIRCFTGLEVIEKVGNQSEEKCPITFNLDARQRKAEWASLQKDTKDKNLRVERVHPSGGCDLGVGLSQESKVGALLEMTMDDYSKLPEKYQYLIPNPFK